MRKEKKVPPAFLSTITVQCTAWFEAIASSQSSYIAANGHYFQGRPTHSVRPADGNEADPDRLSHKPTDQDEAWNDVVAMKPGGKKFSARLDVYDGPQGKGFVCICEAREQSTGKVFRYAKNSGAETYREHDWMEVVEIE